MTNIEVTGHRILSANNLITLQVDDALQETWKKFTEPFFIYSSLAEGSDRLVVRRAFDRIKTSLVAPLPLKKEDYLIDFSIDSRSKFLDLLRRAEKVIELPVSPTRVAAYESAGRYILDHVDVLIALWDGKPSRGQGGTGQIVLEARQRGLPIAWVYAKNHRSNKNNLYVSTQINRAVSYENFPEDKPI